MDVLINVFDVCQQWIFEHVLQPVMFWAGLGQVLEMGYEASGWLLVGGLQILVIVALIGPLQRWRPVEAITDRPAIRTDVLYTLIHRLGLFRVAMFFSLEPIADSAFGALRVAGFSPWHLDGLWPGVTDIAWVSFVLYLVLFDALDYWIHRGQHHYEWWWRLHSLHHSQRQLTMWSDNRNHLIDDVIRSAIWAIVAQLVGVAPGQFIAIVALAQLCESFQHANLRLSFGRLGERLWISPRFHRRHHSIGVGHESERMERGARRTVLGGCNFGVLLPVWDILFGTADFENRYDPTGVRDQVEPDQDGRYRDYGQGFWSQQWQGVLRLLGRA